MKNKRLVISVIVCTYNRAKLLRNCLRSLDKQKVNKNIYEIIVVDNNSTDNTQEIIKNFANPKLKIRIILEKQQGLSFARNRGWKEAKGKYIAYIDDDAIAETDWLEQIIKFFENNPVIDIFGGPYSRFSVKTIPDWIPENCFSFNLGDKTKELNSKNEWLSGTNMIFNKAIFSNYGDFKINLGMQGNKILYGEETEYFHRLKRGGESIYYVPTIRVKHLVPERKLNLWWLLKDNYSHGISHALFMGNKLNLSISVLCLIRSLILFSVIMMINNPLKRRLYLSLSGIFSSLGWIRGSIMSLSKPKK